MVNGKSKSLSQPGIVDYIIWFFLVLLCVSTLYPFLNVLIVSFADMKDYVKQGGILLYPRSIHWDSYRYVLRHSGLVDAYGVTIFITVVGTLINLIMTALGAYVLSNRELPGRNVLMTIIVIAMLFNGGLIPTYLVVRSLHMVDSVWALMIPFAINAWLLILMRNFFQGIPVSLSESARLDGCSEVGILVRIMLPLSLPIVATLALFYGVGHWNEYINVIIYINDPKLSTLQLILRKMYTVSIEQLDGDSLPPPVETIRAATVILSALPIIIVYPFLQKYFVQGVMVGSVKG
ncbi:carbohydrate ABC transporter permease [Paenibacillus qinlingensis]|uniref:Aldouronate transport system permease protein n=1 Tax=Paenibacillus qinlingensis TaxID=1837343 RepID=A0ABU1NZ16_9BACL|nr:carbohydrate ABC transporter permease [Paenibacillus qinlingensis]MDR6552257.1 putative aldouronate transport system permease protein [Paenibacillus qinlingensis]